MLPPLLVLSGSRYGPGRPIKATEANEENRGLVLPAIQREDGRLAGLFGRLLKVLE